ncbi:hypothetical protein [Lysinibacillus fusiformis]|uniref:hypothetical protein n=1 Tax=Lysinibacillus fusiformis TaxID=28031 RepID=UPI003559245C
MGVHAGTDFKDYSTTVGAVNGSAYTDYQVKDTSKADGYLDSYNVGGNYKVDARMTASTGTGSWVRIDDNMGYFIPNSITSGNSTTRMQFSNDVTTPVNVQVTGKWASN